MKLPDPLEFVKGLQMRARTDSFQTFDEAQAQNLLSEYICVEIIKALEEQRKYRWIPVDEDLPEEGEIVIVALKNGAVTQQQYLYGRFYGIHSHDKEDVLAWRRMPEPNICTGRKEV